MGTIPEAIEEMVVDVDDVTFGKPLKAPVGTPGFSLNIGKSTNDGESSQKEESAFEFAQPSKITAKVLSKLNIGGLGGNHGKVNGERGQHYSTTDTWVNNDETNKPTSPIDSKATISYPFSIDAEYDKENPNQRNSSFVVKKVYSKVDGHTVPNVCEESVSIETSPKGLDIEDSDQQQLDAQDLSETGESFGSSHGSPSSKGNNESNLIVDCEIRWEDLHLQEEVGQGSCAVVYRGIWNGSDVAVKVYFGNGYSEGTLLDYKKEIDIMRRLRHPNVVLFMGAVYSQQKLAIVTEFLPRGSLFRTLHKNNQSLDIRRRLRMALDVARGMKYLHHRNPPIVHRDLKSSNLLVDKNWTVKVGDFGLSRLKNAAFLTTKSGTPQWMAPEVLRIDPSNEKSDVFSFGVILWELMTESIPWSNLDSLQVVEIVGFMDRRLDLPEGLDPRVSSIIQDCWHSNPEHRPSFEDIIQRMAELIQTFATISVRKNPEQP